MNENFDNQMQNKEQASYQEANMPNYNYSSKYNSSLQSNNGIRMKIIGKPPRGG